jgi:hypothetical protein
MPYQPGMRVGPGAVQGAGEGGGLEATRNFEEQRSYVLTERVSYVRARPLAPWQAAVTGMVASGLLDLDVDLYNEALVARASLGDFRRASSSSSSSSSLALLATDGPSESGPAATAGAQVAGGPAAERGGPDRQDGSNGHNGHAPAHYTRQAPAKRVRDGELGGVSPPANIPPSGSTGKGLLSRLQVP